MKFILIILAFFLSSCASTATKYKYEQKLAKCWWFEKCFEKVVYKKIPIEQYKCNGVGCEVEFETKGKMKGGTLIPDIPNVRLEQ